MAKSKKNSKSSSAKPSVKVRDMKAKKNPKGGASDIFLKYDQSLKLKESPTLNPGSLNFNKVLK